MPLQTRSMEVFCETLQDRIRVEGRTVQEALMAKVIEFYIPTRFRKQAKWIPEDQRGKVIEFRPPLPKSA